MDYTPPVLSSYEIEPIIIVKPAEEKPKEVLYKVVLGDNLTKIAEAYRTSVERIWGANESLTDPDQITPETTLKIPQEGETIPDRPLPQPAIIQQTGEVKAQRSSPTGTGGFSSSGNTYYKGQCVWYAKNRRPDLPNNLGSAKTWYSRAQAQGIPTGLEPRVGAIGQKGNHVVYVERVNGDGTIYLSEMNYDFKGGFRYRTARASDFKYIY